MVGGALLDSNVLFHGCCRLIMQTVCVVEPGFHYMRNRLDQMPNPAEAHKRRGAHWTFDAERFVRAIQQIRDIGEDCIFQPIAAAFTFRSSQVAWVRQFPDLAGLAS
jgi:predicted alpha/beta-hydrolase family hydrolase